jgi:hypothetical protein
MYTIIDQNIAISSMAITAMFTDLLTCCMFAHNRIKWKEFSVREAGEIK